MRKTRRWLAVGAVLIVAMVALALVRRGAETRRGSPQQGTQAARGTQVPAPMVAVGRLIPMDIPATLSLTATVVSLRETSVFSRVSGYLEEVTVRPGDMVRPGQIVAVVGRSPLAAQGRRGGAAPRKAGAGLGSAPAPRGEAQGPPAGP